MQTLTFRPMQAGDLPVCAQIEATAPDAWSQNALAEELEADIARLFVALDEGGAPVALAAFQLVADEASLNAITVLPALRGQGVGRALLCHCLQQLCAQGAQTCWLEVRAGNQPAQALYRALGFAPIGKRPRFYQNPPEDALLFCYTVPEEEA